MSNDTVTCNQQNSDGEKLYRTNDPVFQQKKKMERNKERSKIILELKGALRASSRIVNPGSRSEVDSCKLYVNDG